MKKITMLLLLLNITNHSIAQKTISPGDKSIDASKLKASTATMAYSISRNGVFEEIGNYKTDIAISSQIIDIKTTLSFLNGNESWKDHYKANAITLKPVSVVSNSGERNLSLNFSTEITGFLQNNKTKIKTMIKEKVNDKYFDISIYPFILSALPLTAGYKATIPVFNCDATDIKKRWSNVIIENVKSNVHISKYTGEHKVWIVDVFEESTKQNYEYNIDKENGKIWRINIVTSDNQFILLVDKETNFNPLKNTFDKETSIKLTTKGSAVISGQVFARDNKNGGALQGMAVFNLNKKQFAAKGTTVILMPYTAYFKEWVSLNKSRYKKLLPLLALPEGGNECIKSTDVYDDKGNFEFANLMPGEYLLTTKFVYEHSATATEVIGQTDHYINGNYMGSNVLTTSYNFIADVNADVKKVVTISKEGEKVEIKLKKTL